MTRHRRTGARIGRRVDAAGLDDTSLRALIEAWEVASTSAKERIDASDTLFVPTDPVVDVSRRARERLLEEATRRGMPGSRAMLVAHLLGRGATERALAKANEEPDAIERGTCLLRIARHVDRDWSAPGGGSRTTREDLLVRATHDGAPGAARALAEHHLGATHPKQDHERARAALADHTMELERAIATSSIDDEDRARLIEDATTTLALIEDAHMANGRASEEVRAVARRFAAASGEGRTGQGPPHLDPFVTTWLTAFRDDGTLDAKALSESARSSGDARLVDVAAVAIVEGTPSAGIDTARELAHHAAALGRPSALGTLATALARTVPHDRDAPREVLEALRTEAEAGARAGNPDCLVAASRAFRRQGYEDTARHLLDAARDAGAPSVGREADRALTDRFAGRLMTIPDEDAPAAVRAHLRLLESCDPDAVDAVYQHALATVTDPAVRAELEQNAKLDTIDSVVQNEVSGTRTSTAAVVKLIDDPDGSVRERAAKACNDLVVHGLGHGDFALVDSLVAQIERLAPPSTEVAPEPERPRVDRWVEAVRRERVALAPEDPRAVERLLAHVEGRGGAATDDILAGVLQRAPGTVRRSPKLVAAAERAGLIPADDAAEMLHAHATRTGDVSALARWFIDHDRLDVPASPRVARLQRLVGAAHVPPPVIDRAPTASPVPELDDVRSSRFRTREPDPVEPSAALEIDDLPPTTIEISLPLLLDHTSAPEERGPTLDDL